MLLQRQDNVYTSDAGILVARNAADDEKSLKFRHVKPGALKRKLESSSINLNAGRQESQRNILRY